MQRVIWTETRVVGARGIALNLPRPVPDSEFYADIALVAYPTGPGDEGIPAPRMTPSATAQRAIAGQAGQEPLLTMPMPMPGQPQSIVLDFEARRIFSSVFLALNEMRDIADPPESMATKDGWI